MHTIYLIPGLGADHRLFGKITLSGHRIVFIEKILPEKGSTMASYAKKLIEQIDTSKPFSIVGASIGGMIAVEMAKIISPEKLVIISSAKTAEELPFHYRLVRYAPIHLIIPGQIIKRFANLVRPIFGPATKEDNKIFSAMLNDKHPQFMQRAIHCIVTWNNTEYRKDIIHLHGDADRTLPIKNISNHTVILGGSHLMTLTKAVEINKILNEIFAGKSNS